MSDGHRDVETAFDLLDHRLQNTDHHRRGTGSPAGVSSGSSVGGSTGTPGSFVGTACNAAVLVQWTHSGGQLTAELQQALLDGSDSSEQVSS